MADSVLRPLPLSPSREGRGKPGVQTRQVRVEQSFPPTLRGRDREGGAETPEVVSLRIGKTDPEMKKAPDDLSPAHVLTRARMDSTLTSVSVKFSKGSVEPRSL